MIRLPARRVLWLGGIGLLDPAVRRNLNIGWNALDQAEFRTLGLLACAADPLMPTSLKITGPDHLRWRSAEIEPGPLGRAA